MRYGPGRVDRPTVSVIVPVYDEAATIAQVVRRIADLPLDKEIVAVDDGSRDRTPAILAGLAAEVDGLRVEHRPHAGKGAAVRHRLGFVSWVGYAARDRSPFVRSALQC